MKKTDMEEMMGIIISLVMEAVIIEGAQGVILGCTVIGLLIHQEDTDILVFDTTRIHAEKAAALFIMQ